VSAIIFLEGGASGPNSRLLQARCRESFKILLEKCGFKGRMPRLFASASREEVFDDFQIELRKPSASYIAMWIDSEDPLKDLHTTWQHLALRDKWKKPEGANDSQVLFMTTCMETLIVADRTALQEHYGAKLQAPALPPLADLENRHRHDVQDKLAHATRNCTSPYAKGKRSFEILAKLNPETLQSHLPSFHRTRQILNNHLPQQDSTQQ